MNAKVLVVDDNEFNVKLLAYNLEDEGYEVLVSFSGHQALEMTKKENPDLILLDIMMPEMDGFEVCRRLKADPQTRDIPVIMVTARTLDEDMIQGLDAGAQDYITKPFDWPIVAARVRSAVRSKHALDTIARMNRQLSEAKREAEAATMAKSQFLANMSHEIRTPMTAILGFSENLLDEKLSREEQINAIHTIHRNGEYLLNLINDILDLSKIEAGRMAIERIACAPCQTIAEVASLMQVRAEGKRLKFAIEYEGAIPETIQTDPIRLRQILINLVGNAIKFTEVGSVRLVTRFVPDQAYPMMQFDVIDTGIGMTEKEAAGLFKSFVQADTSMARKYGGSGLGLTISKRFAEMLGGDINIIEAQPGSGTHFRAVVASGSVSGVKMLDDPKTATVIKATTKNIGEKAKDLDCRILLAEDGRDNQRLISHILKKAGAEVRVVENGKLAVEAVRQSRQGGDAVDIVLMDMQMPVMDGYEATSLLRSEGFDSPIIALTAHAMAGDREKCLQAGCDEYLTKPVDRKKLAQTIQQFLREPVAV